MFWLVQNRKLLPYFIISLKKFIPLSAKRTLQINLIKFQKEQF